MLATLSHAGHQFGGPDAFLLRGFLHLFEEGRGCQFKVLIVRLSHTDVAVYGGDQTIDPALIRRGSLIGKP